MMNKEMLEYLSRRGVKDQDYLDFIANAEYETAAFKFCSSNGYDFMVSHMLGSLDQPGFGLIATNLVLRTENSKWLAIGLIEGDDVICINLQTGVVCIWLIQTGDADFLEVAPSFASFKKVCVV